MACRVANRFTSPIVILRFVTVLVATFVASYALAQFSATVTYDPSGASSNSVAVADINGDGKLDLIVANCGPLGFGKCRDTGNAVGEEF
jgi:hypothetical protein